MLTYPEQCPHCGSHDLLRLRGLCQDCGRLLYSSPAINTGAFRLGTMLLTMVLPAVCLAVWRISPIAATILSIPTTLAFIRTCAALSYSCNHGTLVSLPGVIYTFVVSFVLVCNVALSVIASFSLAAILTGAVVNGLVFVLFGQHNSSTLTAISVTSIMISAAVAGGLVGLTLLRFGWYSDPQRPWLFERR